MLRGLYSVAGTLEVAARNHEAVSENLANINTPGYRRQGTFFDMSAGADAPSSEPGGNSLSPRSGAFTYTESGPLQQTNNPLDIALVGNGFFVLEGPAGPMYTRNGSFQLGPNGTLQARGSGYRVRGQGGPLSLPPEARAIQIAQDGTVSADGVAVGKLDVATFPQDASLRRVGTTLFQGPAPQTPPPGSVRLEQGFREGSNVNAVQEMVSMMIGMRHYEAAQKSMRAIFEAVALNTRLEM